MYKYRNILFCFIHFLLLIVYVLCICVVYIATLICIQQFKHQTAVAAPSLSPNPKGPEITCRLEKLQTGSSKMYPLLEILESIYLCFTVLSLLLFPFERKHLYQQVKLNIRY